MKPIRILVQVNGPASAAQVRASRMCQRNNFLTSFPIQPECTRRGRSIAERHGSPERIPARAPRPSVWGSVHMRRLAVRETRLTRVLRVSTPSLLLLSLNSRAPLSKKLPPKFLSLKKASEGLPPERSQREYRIGFRDPPARA